MLSRFIGAVLSERRLVLILFTALCVWGYDVFRSIPVDAIPNIDANQVIVATDWPGKSPKDVEDQVTYPLSISLLAVPGAESVRGKSMFGYSFVQVTFADDTDFYWARSRVSERLTNIRSSLPDGVQPKLGPDATGLGQIFYYVLKPKKAMDLAKLRSVQDYLVRYALSSVDGVSEVSSIGGYVKQYQIDVEPNKLRFHDITLQKLVAAMRSANTEVGAGTIEQSRMEFIIRGKGYLGGESPTSAKVIKDIENTVVMSKTGVPIRIKDLGFVQSGPDFRRGALDYNGSEAVGGIIVMRYGANPEQVIDRVKAKIASLAPSLGDVEIVPIYDRTELIRATVKTLTDALSHEILITIAVILVFLLHIRTSVIVALALPVAVLLSFVFISFVPVEVNIMSLAGIAIAIGNMVDMGIIICENIYGKLAHAEQGQSKSELVKEAVLEVAPAVTTATLTTVVSFLPVFFLTGRDHKLFTPLAYTKTFALIASLFVSVVLLPALCRMWLTKDVDRRLSMILQVLSVIIGLAVGWLKGPLFGLGLGVACLILARLVGGEAIKPLDKNPVSRLILAIYTPLLKLALRLRHIVVLIPAAGLVLGLFLWLGISPVLRPFATAFQVVGVDIESSSVYKSLKSSFPGIKEDDWIPLDEGSFFYMPTLYPSASFSEAMRVLQTQDTLIKSIPEVKDVLGKIGRADSALDPAPASMVETYITLKPESEWREGKTQMDIWNEVNEKATITGVTPASFLQPIEGRVVMLQSGIKAAMAIRIYGDSLTKLAAAAKAVAEKLKDMPYVNGNTVNPDIVLGKPYAEFAIDRMSAARYGMSVAAINDVIQTALGGKTVTYTIEGRERYPVRIRYPRELRDRIESLEKIPVVTPTGQTVPLGVLARMTTTWGPAAISSENARLVAHVSFSPSGRAGAVETVAEVMAFLRSQASSGALKLPAGFELEPVGSFEAQVEANNRLIWLIPLVMLVNLIIIYFGFRNFTLSFFVFSGVPLAFAGGMILLTVVGQPINTAVWVGFIALFGIAVDDGVVIMTYLENHFRRNPPTTKAEFWQGIIAAGQRRVRPCIMTTVTTLVALVPILLSEGRGADVAKGMAYPIFGGMLIGFMGLFLVPVLYSYQYDRAAKLAHQDAHL